MTGEITAPAPLAVDPAAAPERFVVVLDEALPPGHAANVAAVLAITLGATVEGLMGEALVDGDGRVHPGLIPFGLPILAASRAAIAELRTRAAAADIGVIAFPAHGQQTNDWDAVRRHVAEVPPDELEWLGLVVHGSRRAVNRLTGNLRLLR